MKIRPRLILSGFYNYFLGKNKVQMRRRLNVCSSCPDRKGMTCGICHCFLPSKCAAKYLEDEEGKSIYGCPKGRW
jgi:hypothetical protein|nr:MAG TPA: hypothetical protein [Caudoviricetes sp.]DAU32802.1 MAG TPA: hypothetical protein [Bacteriophage sp.]